ncbi:MAG: hypothetical protein N2484_18860 [Clostridia bacterium]|nr:hypothetical protein [Clostridia bacterium]
MNRLEALRRKLYQALETGDKTNIQDISNQLDHEIVKATPRHRKRPLEQKTQYIQEPNEDLKGE